MHTRHRITRKEYPSVVRVQTTKPVNRIYADGPRRRRPRIATYAVLPNWYTISGEGLPYLSNGGCLCFKISLVVSLYLYKAKYDKKSIFIKIRHTLFCRLTAVYSMCDKLWGYDIITSLNWIFIGTGQEVFSKNIGEFKNSYCNFSISYPSFMIFVPLCREYFFLFYELMEILVRICPLMIMWWLSPQNFLPMGLIGSNDTC